MALTTIPAIAVPGATGCAAARSRQHARDSDEIGIQPARFASQPPEGRGPDRHDVLCSVELARNGW